jgi:hypothetical protein
MPFFLSVFSFISICAGICTLTISVFMLEMIATTPVVVNPVLIKFMFYYAGNRGYHDCREGNTMKVTIKLVEYMASRRREKCWSYAEMARRSGLSWEFFRKLESFLVHDIRDDSASAVARMLGITMDDMRRIANGQTRAEPPPCDPDTMAAEALLRWVRKDPNRQSALVAMGYKGDL